MQIILKRSRLGESVAPPSPVNQESQRCDEWGILPPRFHTGKMVKLPGVPSRDWLGSVKRQRDRQTDRQRVYVFSLILY